MSGDDMRAVIREVLREVTSANGHSDGNGQSNGNGNGRRSASADESAIVPQVPAPPTPAVLRPSTWHQPPAPGEVIGNGSPMTPAAPRPAAPKPAAPTPATPGPRSQSLRAAFNEANFKPTASPASPPPASSAPAPTPTPTATGDDRVEVVTLDSDEDLGRFIRQLISRLDNPRERLAIRTGRLRFRLHRSATAGAAGAGGSGSGAPVTRVERGAVTERMIRAAAADGTRLVLAPGAVLTPLAREQARARGVEIERERR